MKKIMCVLTFLLLGSSLGHAYDIYTAVPPGGSTGKTAEFIASALREKGIGSEVKYQPNCRVAKQKWENLDTQALAIFTPGHITVDPECMVELGGKYLKIMEPNGFANGLCYRKDKTHLGREHFFNKSISKTVGLNHALRDTWPNFSRELNLGDSVKAVIIGNSGVTNQAILGNEFDYVSVQAGWALQNLDKVSCLFLDTDEITVKDGQVIPRLRDITTAQNLIPWREVHVLIGINFTEKQIQELRPLWISVLNNTELKSFNSLPGILTPGIDSKLYEQLMLNFVK
jgi:hypothetical protein